MECENWRDLMPRIGSQIRNKCYSENFTSTVRAQTNMRTELKRTELLPQIYAGWTSENLVQHFVSSRMFTERVINELSRRLHFLETEIL